MTTTKEAYTLRLQLHTMYSDEEEEENGEESHDVKLEALWARKHRRRSSELKIIQGDMLQLQDNSKMVLLVTKNSESAFPPMKC